LWGNATGIVVMGFCFGITVRKRKSINCELSETGGINVSCFLFTSAILFYLQVHQYNFKEGGKRFDVP
jgi:hypothetical protein